MRYPSRRQTSYPGRRNTRIALVCLAVALTGFVLFRFQHRILRSDSASRPASSASPAYKNRSLSQRPPAGSAAASRAKKPAISGWVYALDGAPLAGATLTAATFEVAGNVPSTAGSARSDDQGRFELTVPEGTYQINATMDGYGPTSVIAHTGDTASLFLPKSGVVLGHVRDEQGQPVRRFAIDVVSAVPTDMPAPPPLLSRQIESVDGSFQVDQLPPWDVVIRATAEGYAPAYSPPIGMSPGEKSDLDLVLTKGCVLVGRAEDKAGAPVEQVLVDAEARFYAGSASELSVQTADQAKTGPDGSFRLENVPKGAVVVRGYGGTSAVANTELNITDCDKLPKVLLVMGSGGGVYGVARFADGKPLAGARLTLMHRSIGFVNTASDAEGRFRFSDLPAGPVRIELHHESDQALQFIDVVDGKDNEVDMTLPEHGTGVLRGRVTAGGKPVAGARLLIAANRGQELGIGMHQPITADDGTFTVPSLAKGAYLVSVMSTTTAKGVQVKPDETATVNLEIMPKKPRLDAETITPRRRRERP